MPSTQLNQSYTRLSNPSFLAQVLFQDRQGGCFYPTSDDALSITMTHYYKANTFPRSDWTPVEGMTDIPISANSLLTSPVTGDSRNGAFANTGLAPFDYNFLCVTPIDAEWFPDTGSYRTEFTIVLNSGDSETVVFDSKVVDYVHTIQNLGENFRLVGRSYSKQSDANGVVTSGWTTAGQLQGIVIELMDSEYNVLQTINVDPSSGEWPVYGDGTDEGLIPPDDCMFMDSTTQFAWNWQYLWDDFTNITRTSSTYFIVIRFKYSESLDIWTMPDEVTTVMLLT